MIYYTNICTSLDSLNVVLIGSLSGRGIAVYERSQIALFPPARPHVITLSFKASLTGRVKSCCQMCLAESF